MPFNKVLMMENALIKVNNVTVGYGDKVVLRHVNLNIYPNDYLGIIGPNGGGKTTLVRLLLGLLKPMQGKVEYLDSEGAPCKLNLGYLPQYNKIDRDFPINVRQVVASGLPHKRRFFNASQPDNARLLQQTLQRMELEDLQLLPIRQLSGGQLQRVLLARAVVSKPQVLILDEPNTYIDQHFKEQMYQMLNEINKECAVVIVSHDVAEIINSVKHVACVNHEVHYHADGHIPQQMLEQHFLTLNR